MLTLGSALFLFFRFSYNFSQNDYCHTDFCFKYNLRETLESGEKDEEQHTKSHIFPSLGAFVQLLRLVCARTL